jgi:hypothetical protein
LGNPLGRFREIAPGCAIGGPLPAGWQPLPDLDLLVLCGLTGVGKTTTMALLRPLLDRVVDLPERRLLVDQVVADLYRANPAALDRIERFALTARFRADHPGGVAELLPHLAIRQDLVAAPLTFDGLRGADEIRYAASALPQARFVALLATDFMRLNRLLRRSDTFDRVVTSADGSARRSLPPGLDALFTRPEIEEMEGRVASGALSEAELAAKLAIVREERLNYDPDRMMAALAEIDPARRLAIDTVRHDPPAVAALIADFLRTSLRPARGRADACRH